MQYALKFAYDGQAFEGYARQPEMNTVEGEIIGAMESLGIIESAKANNFQSASRTDRGVGAAGNVIAIDTGFQKNALIPALNSRLEGAHFWAIVEADGKFNPRHAKERWYRYVLPRSQCPDVGALKMAAQYFIGERDFREFAKKDSGEENTLLAMKSIEILEEGDFVFIDFRAQRFLWQMVRRLVSAMLAGNNSGVEVGPAPAENLVLMAVIYDFDFEAVSEKPRYFSALKNEAEVRAVVMGQILKFTSV